MDIVKQLQNWEATAKVNGSFTEKNSIEKLKEIRENKYRGKKGKWDSMQDLKDQFIIEKWLKKADKKKIKFKVVCKKKK